MVGGVEAVVEVGGVGGASVGVVGEVGWLGEDGSDGKVESPAETWEVVGDMGVSSAKPTQERGIGW